MGIKVNEITPSNVWAWIQGKGRKKLSEIDIDLFKSPRYIQEIITWRYCICNQRCLSNKSCIVCECDMPDKLYSDKECESGCYPAMFGKDEWNRLKSYCARKRIDMFTSNFDWKSILDDVNSSDVLSFYSIIGKDDSSVTLGESQAQGKMEHTFNLFNPKDSVMTINNINASCSCVSFHIDSLDIDPFSYAKLEVTVDTKGKNSGLKNDWLTIRYNDIERMNLQLKYIIK